MNWVTLLGAAFDGLRPFLPLLVGIAAFLMVLRFPMSGRGPGRQGRDPWRSFKFAARRRVMERAGGRCEATSFLVWGRCNHVAIDVDHVYPWSRGGATIVSNGQALCRHHNRAKSSWPPPWWYIRLLERRRRGYFPAGEDVRGLAAMTDADRAARAKWAARKSE